MTLLLTLNPEHATAQELATFSTREAARAIVTDAQKNIALLYVSKNNYYKLPGGGLENSEDYPSALKRECREEIGCDIEITHELGTIVEYRKFCMLKQTSHCYVAKLNGEKGTPEFTEDELEEGFQILWLPYHEALHLLSENKATDLEGREYIVPRDSIFLKAAKRFI